MNEKVFEELHYHSGLVANGCWNQLDDYDQEAIKRFGDLIVKMCANFADEHNDNAEGVNLGVGRAIREHFGVEE